MNILRIITSMNPENGGPCQGIRNSIPALKKIDVHNEVVCFDSPDASFLGKDDFTIHAIGPAKGPYAYCPALKPWLANNLHRFDVVIIHGLWQYNGYGAYSAWKKFKRSNAVAPKLYVMPHGMLDPYFQRAKSRRLKAIRNWFFWKLIEGEVINNADGILFTCEQELVLARETFTPYRPKGELNVSYGIKAPPAFSEKMGDYFYQQFPYLKSKPFLLFLSRIHEKKGTDLLIKAYIEIKKNNDAIPLLVIAGPGMDTDFGKQLQELSAGEPNIIFPGMLSGDLKWSAFYLSEAFVLPSHQENFGIAVAEAMACAKAVLITDQINIWQEIAQGGGGIISTDTTQGVTKQLTKWFSLSAEEKDMMGKKSKTIYEETFNIDAAASKMIGVIKESFYNG